MSLILDALARAERDKRRETQPLSSMLADAEVAADDRGGLSRPRLLAVVAGMALFIGLAVVAWRAREQPAATMAPITVAQRSDAGTAVAAASAPDSGRRPAGEAPRAVAERRASVPAAVGSGAAQAAGNPTGLPPPVAPSRAMPVPKSRPPSTGALRAEVASLYAAASAGADDEAAPGGEVRNAPRPVTTAEAETMRETVPAEPVAQAPRPVDTALEEPVDLDSLLREVRVEKAAQGLSDHPVPLLAALSKQFRDSVPTLMYLRHDYDSRGASTVLINGETLRVGGRTRGVEVREILADSVICRYDGTEFRLRALNSWVNL